MVRVRQRAEGFHAQTPSNVVYMCSRTCEQETRRHYQPDATPLNYPRSLFDGQKANICIFEALISFSETVQFSQQAFRYLKEPFTLHIQQVCFGHIDSPVNLGVITPFSQTTPTQSGTVTTAICCLIYSQCTFCLRVPSAHKHAQPRLCAGANKKETKRAKLTMSKKEEGQQKNKTPRPDALNPKETLTPPDQP
jgi:hypothetical protein